MKRIGDYANLYDCIHMERTDGVLDVRLHTDGGPVVWSQRIHQQLPSALSDIGDDPANRVIVLTGTGDEFIDRIDVSDPVDIGDEVPPTGWNHHYRLGWEGERLMTRLLDIEIPIIAAVNGPARIHAELALLSDIVLAADGAVFGDRTHFADGVVPGDGVHVVWPALIGPNRARYVFLTGKEFSAGEAMALGLVAEVHAYDRLLPRALELASALARKPRLTLRYTRALLTHALRKSLTDQLAYGIALEGISIAAMKSEARYSAQPR